MFLRMLWRAALLRRSRALAALLAVTIAAAVATTLLNLYQQAIAGVHTELRSYGANALLVARGTDTLAPATLAQLDAKLSSRDIAVPFAYTVARTTPDLSATAVVVAGTDMKRVRKLNSWWSVTSKQDVKGPVVPALFGTRAAKAIGNGTARIQLWFDGKPLDVTPSGILMTGSDDDSRVFMDLDAFSAWTGKQASVTQLSLAGSRAEVEQKIAALQRDFPAAEVRPVRQISEAEERVLGKTRSTVVAASILVILTAALCVLATLISWVLDRRRDFAVMKALGASQSLLSMFFASEVALLGAVGALIGFAVGIAAAAVIGRVNFNAVVSPNFMLLPLVLVGGIAVTLVAALAPLGILRRIEPAAILRGQ
jgi:putative ABC transport system permease protein